MPRLGAVIVWLQVVAPFALKTQTRLTACTCSCCEASTAPHSFLRTGNVAVVCTPLFAIAQASSCPAECNDLKAASAAALARAEMDVDEAATDYSRFCLQNCIHDAASQQNLCTPADGAATAPAEALTSSLESSLLTEGAQQVGTKPKEDTGALVAQAEGRKATALANEARVASFEATLAAAKARTAASLELAHNRGSLAEEVKAELQDTAARAGAYAARAQEAAKTAEEEVKEIENSPKVAAQEAAQAAIKQFGQQNELNEKFLHNFQAHATPTVALAGPTATGAAAPYRAAIREVQSTQSLWEAKASQLKSDADLLRASSQSVHRHIHSYEAAGDMAGAQNLKSQAHDLLVKSVEKETEAAEAMDQARRIGLMVPKYEEAAADAAARASILGSQKWMPPAATYVAPAAFAPSPAPAASPA
mmetsp:Transcript_14018/g.26200  ORF Transcript_14018/g.26200 Transcript_14018/m.26200 type:complete len:422 (-) Transcript_14018:36-1301(-)